MKKSLVQLNLKHYTLQVYDGVVKNLSEKDRIDFHTKNFQAFMYPSKWWKRYVDEFPRVSNGPIRGMKGEEIDGLALFHGFLTHLPFFLWTNFAILCIERGKQEQPFS